MLEILGRLITLRINMIILIRVIIITVILIGAIRDQSYRVQSSLKFGYMFVGHGDNRLLLQGSRLRNLVLHIRADITQVQHI